MKNKNYFNRIIEIDILRGIAVILMILDHTMYDIYGLMPEIFNDFPSFKGTSYSIVSFAHKYWNWDVRVIVRFFFIAVFLGLTGICCSFSKSNLKRGLKLFAVAVALTFATYFIGIIIDDINIMITFGVLHCIALALIIIGLLEKIIDDKWFYLAVGTVMIILGIILSSDAPYIPYENNNIFVLVFRQIIGTCECGGDCFPFLLYGGQTFVGVFLGKLIYKDKKSLFPNLQYSNNVITFIGRNSLAVYFAHQVVIPLLIGIILLICGFSISL